MARQGNTRPSWVTLKLQQRVRKAVGLRPLSEKRRMRRKEKQKPLIVNKEPSSTNLLKSCIQRGERVILVRLRSLYMEYCVTFNACTL